jgi:hypothetical protein
MIADRGTGGPRTVIVDVSGLGIFSAATATTIDANTASSGPVPLSVTLGQKLSVTLGGYGVGDSQRNGQVQTVTIAQACLNKQKI